ncbi:MAG: MoaD/ThiS family protein [Firmicutes bacterium]|nr:MoaD/ThiS family protein [Bacillota bacterium]
MQIWVKYFGAPIANLGPKATGFKLPPNTTILQLLHLIGEGMKEKEKKLLAMTSCMVNGSHVGKHYVLEDGDEVYILYPVSGG